MDLGYDYETAGRMAMDYDEYRSAMDKGPLDDYKEGGVIGRMMRGSPAMTAAMKKFYGIEDEEDTEKVKLPKKKPKQIKKPEGKKLKITEEGEYEIVDDDNIVDNLWKFEGYDLD